MASGEAGEAAITARDDGWRWLLDSAHEGYVAMDGAGLITDINSAAEAMFGRSRDEAVGCVLSDTLIPERLRHLHAEGLKRFLDTGEGPMLGKRVQLPALHRDGHEFPVELTISVMQHGADRSFHAFVHDLSERKRLEQYLLTEQAVTAVLAKAQSLDEAVPDLLRTIGEGMGWSVGVYWSPDVNGEMSFREIWSIGTFDVSGFERACREIVFPAGVGVPGRVWRDGSPLFIAELGTDAGFLRRAMAVEAGLSAAIGLPVIALGRVCGVIEFFAQSPRDRKQDLVELMSKLTEQIGHFVSVLTGRQEARLRLERLALTDDLTRLPNRRAWSEGLQRELSRARRRGEPLCVALLDIDHFKRFNDERGHQAGDEALRQSADAWRSRLRPSDLMARYGGEEFALALTEAPQAAREVLERLRAATPAPLTISAGLAAWNGTEQSQELVERADRALYEAKREGRNRAVVATS